MTSSYASAVSGPTPGCVINRRVTGRCSTSSSSARVSSWIFGVSWSSNSSKSCRRCVAHGANAIDSNSLRPAARHNAFLRRRPSLSATTCNWFITRVRICTSRCRCHSSCRRSRFSASGTQIRGKRSSIISRNNNCASCRFGLLLAHPFRADLGRVPDPQLKLQLPQQPLEPARVPAGLHPHPHGYIALLQFPVKLLGLFAMRKAALAQLTCVCVHKSNLLEARMIIAPYNQHVRLLSSEPFGWFAPPKFTRAWEPKLLWNHHTYEPVTLRIHQ